MTGSALLPERREDESENAEHHPGGHGEDALQEGGHERVGGDRFARTCDPLRGDKNEIGADGCQHQLVARHGARRIQKASKDGRREGDGGKSAENEADHECSDIATATIERGSAWGCKAKDAGVVPGCTGWPQLLFPGTGSLLRDRFSPQGRAVTLPLTLPIGGGHGSLRAFKSGLSSTPSAASSPQ